MRLVFIFTLSSRGKILSSLYMAGQLGQAIAFSYFTFSARHETVLWFVIPLAIVFIILFHCFFPEIPLYLAKKNGDIAVSSSAYLR